MLCSSIRTRIPLCFRDYDQLQYIAVILIYIQIGCALIGSLGAIFNGVLIVHLVITLFALVAIESSSQSLGRAYALLLACSILLDIFWFILYSHQIWKISSEKYETLIIFSLWLTLSMQIIGLFVRLVSSVVWIQIYRLGVSSVDSALSSDLRNSFLNPPTSAIARETSNADEILGGSIYDPVYYSSLFEDIENGEPPHQMKELKSRILLMTDHFQQVKHMESASLLCPLKMGKSLIKLVENSLATDSHSSSSPLFSESSQLKSCLGRSFEASKIGAVG